MLSTVLVAAEGGVLCVGVAALLATIFPYVLVFVYGELWTALERPVSDTLAVVLVSFCLLILGSLLAFAIGAVVRGQWPLLIGLLQVFFLRGWFAPVKGVVDSSPRIIFIAPTLLLPVAWTLGGYLGNCFRRWSEAGAARRFAREHRDASPPSPAKKEW